MRSISICRTPHPTTSSTKQKGPKKALEAVVGFVDRIDEAAQTLVRWCARAGAAAVLHRPTD